MSENQLIQKVMDSIDEKGLIDFTKQVVAIDSTRGGEGPVAEVFLRQMEKFGLETQSMEVEKDRPDILGWIRGDGSGGQSLTMNGHTDTVKPVLGWTRDPYSPEIVDGKMYGLGTSNMKTSDAAMVYAAAAIKKAGVKLKNDLLVEMVVGECGGGIGTKYLMKKGVITDTFISGEPTNLNLVSAHAASLYFNVNIYGRGGHFSTPDPGLNAIVRMSDVIRRLGPVHTEIEPGGWLKFEDRPLYDGLPRYQVGVINGGVSSGFNRQPPGPDVPGGLPTGFLQPATTPDFCTAIFNFRVPPSKSIQSLKQDLEGLLAQMDKEQPGFKYEVTIFREMPGMESLPNSPVVKAISESYVQAVGKQPNVGGVKPFVFIGSDAGHMQAAGIKDGAMIGPGTFGGSVPNEHCDVDKLIASSKIYAGAALRICGIAE